LAPDGKAEYSPGDGSRREEALESAQPFLNSVDGGGVGDSQIARGAERIAGDYGDMFAFEQMLG
jgi:hypothetical protein